MVMTMAFHDVNDEAARSPCQLKNTRFARGAALPAAGVLGV